MSGHSSFVAMFHLFICPPLSILVNGSVAPRAKNLTKSLNSGSPYEFKFYIMVQLNTK